MRRIAQSAERQKATRLGRWVGLVLCLALALCAFTNSSKAKENSYFRTVTVEPGVRTESINCIGCSVIVKGDLDGEIVTIGGNVTIFGKVRKDIVAVGGNIRLKTGAQANADVVAIGGMVGNEGAVIAPHGMFISLPWIHLPGQLSVGWRGILVLLCFHALSVLLPLLTLRPRRIQNVVVASHRWLVTGLVGMAAILVIALVLILIYEELHADDTVELIVIVLFFAALMVGVAGVTFAIGDRFFPGRIVAAFLIGGLLLVALELVPYLGFVVMVLGSCWATGSALWSGMGFRGPQPPVRQKLPTSLKLTS